MCNERDILRERHASLNLRLYIRCITNMYTVLVVKLIQFEEGKGVFRCYKSKNHRNTMAKNKNGMGGKFIMIIESLLLFMYIYVFNRSLSANPMCMLKNLKYSSR